MDYKVFDVEVSASNNAGRNEAIIVAQRKALGMLLADIAIDKSIVAKMSDEEISAMVKDLEFLDEKFTTKSYKAYITFTFKKKAILELLKHEKQQIPEERVLLLPVFINQNKVVSWHEKNLWRKNLEKVIYESELNKKYILLSEELEELTAENFDQVEFSQLTALVKKYQADEIIIATAKYFIEEKNQFTNISLNLRHLKPEFSQSEHKPYIFADGGSAEFLLHEVAKDFLLNQRYHKHSIDNNLDIKKNQTLLFTIELRNFSDWLYIKQTLIDMFTRNNITVTLLNRHRANVSIENNELVGNIAQLFNRFNISVKKNQDLLILQRR
jgi:RNase H-fold protein (predicted Holliday junction resolvase)